MRLLVRVFGLSCIFMFICMIFMQMMAINIRQDELNNAISSAMTGTQIVMQKNIEDRLMNRDTARYKIDDEASYKDLFIENFAKLVGASTFESSVGSQSELKNYGEELGSLPELEKEGYTFLGWYTQPTGGTRITSSTVMGDSDMEVYAHWELVDYTISYDLGGGSVSGNPTTYTVESNDITLNNPTKAGKVFLGWTWDGHSVPSKNVVIPKGTTGNLKYYANWE